MRIVKHSRFRKDLYRNFLKLILLSLVTTNNVGEIRNDLVGRIQVGCIANDLDLCFLIITEVFGKVRICIMVDGKIAALNAPGELKRKYNADTMDEVFYELARGAKRNE